MKRFSVVSILSLLSLAAAGCSSTEPSALSPSGTGTSGTTGSGAAALSKPNIVSPKGDEQVGVLEQPYAFTFDNVTVTGNNTAAVTYEVDVATDPAFPASSIVFNQKGIAQGSGGKTSINVAGLHVQHLHWRVRATNGTATSVYSDTAPFEIEQQGGHLAPGDISEEYCQAIIYGVGDEFPELLNDYGSEGEAVAAAEELLLRIIWHLKLAGFDAARQRNPSSAISNDKFTVYIRNSWRTYDIFRLGYAGVATEITPMQDVGAPDPQPNDGIGDDVPIQHP